MDYLFGGRKTVSDQLSENKRKIVRVIRELEREKKRLERTQTQTTTELKKLAKENQMDAVRIKAKQFVRNKNYVKKLSMMITNLEALNVKLLTLKSTNAMSEAMRQTTRVLQRMNASMNLPKLQSIMMEFEKQSSILDSKEEMMNDTMDDVLEADDPEEEDAVVNKVLDELGIEMGTQLAGLPNPDRGTGIAAGPSRAPIAAAEGSGGGGGGTTSGGASGADSQIDENDLEARLARLKRN